MRSKQSNATKQATRLAASERAAAVRAQQERKDRRTRALVVAAVIAVMVLATVGLSYVMSRMDTTGDPGAVPSGAVDTHAVPMGSTDAPVTVTVYEDLMCPFCGQFEAASSQMLKEYAASGDVEVRYHLVSFLDDASTTDYSTRAANAVAAVLDTAGPEVAVEFHDALFVSQPEEGGPGLTDEELIDLAVEAGADESQIRGPIEDLAFEQWVVNSTGVWQERGLKGTPAVTVDGETVEFTDAENLTSNTKKAIDEALAGS